MDENPKPEEQMSIEEIEKLAISSLLKTMNINNEVLEELRDTLFHSEEHGTEAAANYSGVAKAQIDAIREIAAFAHNRAKNKTAKELKEMDISGRMQIAEHKTELGDKAKPQNAFFICNQQDMFKRLKELFDPEEEEEKPVQSARVIESVPDDPSSGTSSPNLQNLLFSPENDDDMPERDPEIDFLDS